jgi:hypothetical protein
MQYKEEIDAINLLKALNIGIEYALRNNLISEGTAIILRKDKYNQIMLAFKY